MTTQTNVPAVEEKQTLTEEILNEAKTAYGYATNCLLSPPGSYGHAGDKAYYAHFAMKMNVTWGTQIPTAGVSVTDRVNLLINPFFWLKLNIVEQMELLIHEIEHIVYLHPLRSKNISKNNNDLKLFNIATDANINMNLKVLTTNLGVTIERVNEELAAKGLKHRLDPKDHAEVHFEKLKQIQEEMKQKGQGKMPDGMGEEGECDDHSTWGESIENEELAKAVIQEAANKAAEATGAGNVPNHIARQLADLNQASVNWAKQMAQFAVRTLKFNRERTRNRRNRRFGVIQQGSRKKPQVKLAVCCDSSGSVSDTSFQQFFAEIDAIAQMGIEITVIDADCGVAAIYEYDRKKPVQRHGNGGTAYAPAINKAKELRVDGIIYFGDMDASDVPTDPKLPFLWAVVGNQNPPANFGKVVRVIEQDRKK
jgi:predicted metal-dependent peptidase